jgi:hypothetical protein
MAHVLIVYYYHEPRRSITDHLRSFDRYGGHDCYYLNAAVWGTPRWVTHLPVDLIIFHTTFLSQRWDPVYFRELTKRAAVFAWSRSVKVAIPQDEFVYTDNLRDFIRIAGIGHVFSAAAPSEWPKIYAGVDFDRVRFTRVLTGYLDDSTVQRIDRLADRTINRTIDIGYRAWKAEPWLGRHGFLKQEMTVPIREKAKARGLVTDISTEPGDTLMGDDWYRFLLRCRYTIGVEGGASILDRDGTIRLATEKYTSEHPGAEFPEIEKACFPGMDGSLNLFAISPRHLEACATKTCQILVEGSYNGILEPGRHFIELKRDLSNIDDVLDAVAADRHRHDITSAAYRDIVTSRRYSYRTFVETVLAVSEPPGTRPSSGGSRAPVLYLLRLADALAMVLSFAWRAVTTGGPGKWIKNAILKPLLLGSRRYERPVNSRRGCRNKQWKCASLKVLSQEAAGFSHVRDSRLRKP